ncbi:MAG TPA: hypothetical protein VL916_08705, partial [Ilumatobacteraceae bacterium]|nr:hypothetical protein [Ilumatobacteraceae bacterium]
GNGQLSDTATVSGRVNPTGAQTVTFRLYSTSDVACTSAPVFTSTVTLASDTATSAAYTPTAPGTYRWIATYDGDVNNAAVSGRCGDPTETRTVDAPPATLPPTGGGVAPWALIALGALVAGALLLYVGRRRVGQSAT